MKYLPLLTIGMILIDYTIQRLSGISTFDYNFMTVVAVAGWALAISENWLATRKVVTVCKQGDSK